MSPQPWRWAMPGLLLAGTITKLPPEARGAVVVCGSHGGRYPGYLGAKAGLRAVILNDAGIGRDEAGIGSLPYLEALGIAAATVAAESCLIGEAADMAERGRISRVNAPAAAAGLVVGQGCGEAARLLMRAPVVEVEPPPVGEGRSDATPAGATRAVLLLDSAALVRPEDAGAIIVTGSHGGLIGGEPRLALQVEGFAAAFNDAGRPDGPGTSRLPALDRRGIAAVTVAAASARIGEARSTLDGTISAANPAADRLGAEIGRPLRTWIEAIAR